MTPHTTDPGAGLSALLGHFPTGCLFAPVGLFAHSFSAQATSSRLNPPYRGRAVADGCAPQNTVLHR